MIREYFWDALIFPFFEKNGIKNFLIFLILSAIGSGIAVLFRDNQIIYWIITIIVIIYSFGFLTILAHNKIQSKEEIIPKWNDFRGFFISGFFAAGIALIYSITIFLIIHFLSIYVVGRLLAFTVNYPIPALISFYTVIYLEKSTPLFLFLFLPIVYVLYAQNLKSSEAFRLIKIFSLVFRNIPVLLLMYLNLGILSLPYMLSREVTKGIKWNVAVDIPDTIIDLYVLASIVYLSASYGRELLIKEKILKTIDQQP